jgi:hypothetical protein
MNEQTRKSIENILTFGQCYCDHPTYPPAEALLASIDTKLARIIQLMEMQNEPKYIEDPATTHMDSNQE